MTTQLVRDRLTMNYAVDVEFPDETAPPAPVAASATRRAGHDVSAQLRQLKGTHEGGQFTRTLDGRVIDAVQKWLGGDHEPLNGFGTVQLRKVIERRGLPKPAARTSAVAMRRTLLDDVRRGGPDLPSAPPSLIAGRDALLQTPAVAPHAFSHSAPTDTLPLTPAQRKALNEYANDAQRINARVRAGNIAGRDATTVRQLDKVMGQSKLQSDVELWRGLSSGRGTFGDRLDGDLTGFEWPEDAYVSTSANRQVAAEFGGAIEADQPAVVMRLVAPEGTGAVTLSDWGSGHAIGGQAEVLLQRGLHMRVIADHGTSPEPGVPAGVRTLDVEIVPKDTNVGPGELLAGLDPNLTPAQKRARLRSAGVSKADIDTLVPLPPRKKASKKVQAAAGHDVTPGHDELHHYWTRDPRGLKKWVGSPHPWTTLYHHLLKYMNEGMAKRAASAWFLEVFHFASGSDLNRVTHGKPPRGHLVGPG
jgi:hypothetical protein